RKGDGVSPSFGSGFEESELGIIDDEATITPSVGFGLGAKKTEAKLMASLVDINGDGLPDLVIKKGSYFVYYLNTGTDFSNSEKTFYNGQTLDETISIAKNVYGSFTVGVSIPVLFLVIKITGSPTLSFILMRKKLPSKISTEMDCRMFYTVLMEMVLSKLISTKQEKHIYSKKFITLWGEAGV